MSDLPGTEGQDRESYTDDQDRDSYSDPTDPEVNPIGAAKAGRLNAIELRAVVTCGCTTFWHNKQTLGGILQEFAPKGADRNWGLRAVDRLRNKGKLNRHNLPTKGCDGCG